MNGAHVLRSVSGLRALVLIILTLSLLTMTFCSPVYANPDEAVVMKVKAGFNGYTRAGQTVPLQVEMGNSGPDINGTLEVHTAQNQVQVLYTKAVVLPRGSKKAYTLYISPRTDTNTYNVRLVVGGQEIARETARLNLINPGEVVVGVLASDISALNHLGALKMPGQNQRVTVIHLQARDIPEKSLVLDQIDVLAINDFPTSTLSTAQMQAIQSWVERGGALVLGGGSAWQKTLLPLPASLLPVELSGSITAARLPGLEKLAGYKLASGAGVVVARGNPDRGTVLAREGDNPIVVQAHLGRGNILYLAFDLAAEPLAAWAGNQKLWLDLLTRADPHNAVTASQARMEKMERSSGELNWALRNIPASDMPSTRLLGGLLLAYILVLGLGIYLLLKKVDRREWGWAIIPLAAVLVFATSYMVGFKGKGRDVFTNIISIVRLDPGTDYSQVDSYLGVFAPTRSNYSLNLPGEKLVNVLTTDIDHRAIVSTGAGNRGPVVATVQQGADTRVEFADFTRWSMRCVQTTDIIPRPGEIESHLRTQKGKITGTVTNNTTTTLTDCVVASQYGHQKLGRLEPGESVEVEIYPRVSFANNRQSAYYQVLQPYPIHYPRQRGYSDMMGSGPEFQQRLRILEIITGRGGEQVGDALVFIGWSQDNLQGVLAGEQPGRSYSTTAYVSSLEVNLHDSATVSIPPGIINGRLAAFEGRHCYRGPEGYHFEGGKATFQLDLPYSPGDLQLSQLVLWTPVGNYQMAKMVNLALYNWSAGEWDTLKYRPVGNLIDKPEQYISETGAMRVMIGPQQGDQYLLLGGVTVSINGQQRVNENALGPGGGKPGTAPRGRV